jgi:FAD synthase
MALEVNILNFSGDIYNAQLEVIFVRFMREDIKFESLEALRAQLEIDGKRWMRSVRWNKLVILKQQYGSFYDAWIY